MGAPIEDPKAAPPPRPRPPDTLTFRPACSYLCRPQSATIRAQLAVLAKQLEAPAAAFTQWLGQTMQCLCLPIQQQLSYKRDQSEAVGTYPPPVYTDAKPLI